MDEHKHNQCGGCDGGFCGGGHGALRWVIGIVVLMLVFWMGMRIGEIKSEMYSGGYGNYPTRGMMRIQGGYGDSYGTYGPNMMYGYGVTQSAPATVIVPSAK